MRRKWFFVSLGGGVAAIAAHLAGLVLISRHLAEHAQALQAKTPPPPADTTLAVGIFLGCGLAFWGIGLLAWMRSIARKEDRRWRLIPLSLLVGYLLLQLILV